ncbi:hypothetical protein GYMLUDRAFT_53552 [Collybiopsis luxurians FD-317 M1]|nr:hypothetical protein GYMLUDRAFT_53552 [Collybiopsis luxurians FD-317 M1]
MSWPSPYYSYSSETHSPATSALSDFDTFGNDEIVDNPQTLCPWVLSGPPSIDEIECRARSNSDDDDEAHLPCPSLYLSIAGSPAEPTNNSSCSLSPHENVLDNVSEREGEEPDTMSSPVEPHYSDSGLDTGFSFHFTELGSSSADSTSTLMHIPEERSLIQPERQRKREAVVQPPSQTPQYLSIMTVDKDSSQSTKGKQETELQTSSTSSLSPMSQDSSTLTADEVSPHSRKRKRKACAGQELSYRGWYDLLSEFPRAAKRNVQYQWKDDDEASESASEYMTDTESIDDPEQPDIPKKRMRKLKERSYGGRRYPCPDPRCSLTFGRTHDASRHYKFAHCGAEDNENVCQLCKRQLSRPDALMRHMRNCASKQKRRSQR